MHDVRLWIVAEMEYIHINGAPKFRSILHNGVNKCAANRLRASRNHHPLPSDFNSCYFISSFAIDTQSILWRVLFIIMPSEEINKSNNLLLFLFFSPSLYSSSRSETRHMATWTRIPSESQFDVPSIPGFPAASITCSHSATGKLKHSLWTDSFLNYFYCHFHWIRTSVPTSLAVSMRTTFMIITIIVFSAICDAKRKKSEEEKNNSRPAYSFQVATFPFHFWRIDNTVCRWMARIKWRMHNGKKRFVCRLVNILCKCAEGQPDVSLAN